MPPLSAILITYHEEGERARFVGALHETVRADGPVGRLVRGGKLERRPWPQAGDA